MIGLHLPIAPPKFFILSHISLSDRSHLHHLAMPVTSCRMLLAVQKKLCHRSGEAPNLLYLTYLPLLPGI